MTCKFCNAEIEENQTFCHICGRKLTEEQHNAEPAEQVPEVASEEELPVQEPVEEAMETIFAVEETVQVPEADTKQKKNVAPLVLSIIAAVLALASLAVLLLIALGVDLKSLLPRGNDIYNKDSYTVTEEKAAKKGDTVIATIGDKELTNAQLQLYYRMQVLDFLEYYGSYVEQLELDITKPLSEQSCYFDEAKTWEQYLLDIAIDTWQNYQVIGLLAEEAGYQLSGEWLESYEKLPEDLKTQAADGGYDSVDALLKEVIGPACTEEIYTKYVQLVYLCNAYYGEISEQMIPTDEEIAAYFDENAAAFTENGITKEMGNIADVRHILVCPKGGTQEETTGQTTYSEEEWDACLKEAEKILEEWKNGEATEESFAKLVSTYTEDTGSASTGGLYEDIAPGASYVENFLNWTIDVNRKVGDTDIVKTEYGYHIMYYVEGEPYWPIVVGNQLQSERITDMTNAAEEKWPLEVNYRKIVLSELELS